MNSGQIILRKPLIPFLVSLLVILQLLDPSKVWTFLLILLGGIWLLAYVWSHLVLAGIKFQREMRFGWAQVGDRIEERFTIENRSALPVIWMEVSDQSNIPGYFSSRVCQVGAQQVTRWKTQGICQHRGLFTLGPTLLRTSDPFGIYEIKIHASASMSLMVMPPVISLPHIEIATGGLTGASRPRSAAPEPTVSAASVRAYTAGDNLHSIHWPTSARRDDLFVRVFEGTPAGNWWIILDLEAGVQVGEGWDSTTENAIVLAASLTELGLQEKKAVGLAANSAELLWVPPQPAESQRWNILRHLALAETGNQPLAVLLSRVRDTIHQRGSLILITPNLRGDWIKPLIPFIWQGTIPTVILLDPNSFGGSGNLQPVIHLLANQGIRHYRFTRQDFDRPEARPGRSGQWEWRVSATGKALPLHKPANLGWRVLK